jgi:exonuclease III
VQIHALNDLSKKIETKGYKFYHNSPRASRGVGLLIKKSFNINIAEIKKDEVGNFLLVKFNCGGKNLLVGAIYGPNDNDLHFYNELSANIETLNCEHIILGGDWNATWDPRPPNENLDVINMANIPSRTRSNAIRLMAQNRSLIDPFRMLHPIKSEFTYVPNARINVNRSRIDFFFIDTGIAEDLVDCKISPAVSSTSFDHKKINLTLGKLGRSKTLTK